MRHLHLPITLLILTLTSLCHAEKLTLPRNNRPEWLSKEGLVMAGSWESLPFRVRRDGGPGYAPTAEQVAAYEREHSDQMIQRLEFLGRQDQIDDLQRRLQSVRHTDQSVYVPESRL